MAVAGFSSERRALDGENEPWKSPVVLTLMALTPAISAEGLGWGEEMSWGDKISLSVAATRTCNSSLTLSIVNPGCGARVGGLAWPSCSSPPSSALRQHQTGGLRRSLAVPARLGCSGRGVVRGSEAGQNSLLRWEALGAGGIPTWWGSSALLGRFRAQNLQERCWAGEETVR